MATHVTYARGFFRNVKPLVGTPTGPKVHATVDALARDWPSLPAEGDDDYFLAPVLRVWARRVSGTTLRVIYASTHQGVTIYAVVSGT